MSNNSINAEKHDNVYYSLEDTARSCLENHEASLTLRALFQEETRKAFTGDYHRETAEYALRSRIQQPIETLTSFIEDVLRLLRRAHAIATEER